MTKTPPHRRGITFEVGAQLEARDSLKNWYAANIEKIDYEDEKVLIHYRQWSHRYDEWFDWNSPYLRPVERINLRRQGLQQTHPAPSFQVNDKVLASWSDCRYYPAKILTVNKDGSYTVKFYDGVVKTIKGVKVKPFRRERCTGKIGQQRRKREQNGRDWRSKENGNARTNGSRHSASDQERDSETEEEEDDDDDDDQNLHAVTKNLQNGTPGSDSEKPQIVAEEGQTEIKTDANASQERSGMNGDRVDPPEIMEQEQHAKEWSSEEKEEVSEEVFEENISLPRRTRSRTMDGKEGETKPSIPELRKRRASLGQMPAPKRTRADGSTDRGNRIQTQKQAKSDSIPVMGSNEKDSAVTTETQPSGGSEASSDLVSLVRRQVHLPTTNKYSREPLYRVIKNQPPPILSIELDHNPFKCKVPGCQKSFRKASLLHYHMKYYHSDSSVSPPRTVQTRASEKQAAAGETLRRRRTVSLHSPLTDSKSGHTLSPPTANGVHRQRSPHCGQSKENQQVNRRFMDDRNWNPLETAGIKDKMKLQEKRTKDFLRIKLKKKKKRKKTSGDDSLSDWSTDSPTWSEEELEAELDLTTPFTEQGVAVEPHGSEIVRCVCAVQEENDFMIQCEECMCWQHGTCMGLLEDNVPETYTCYICREPPGQRQSQRYWYDRDWLMSGHMYGLSFLEENYSHQNGRKITAAHQLLGDIHHVFEVLNGLQLKMSILQTQAHPDLKIWRQPWKQSSRRKDTIESDSAPPAAMEVIESHKRDSAPTEKPSCVPSFQDSYISSEHCYQKPRAYYPPAVEQRLVVETRGSSELEDSLHSTEDLLEMERRYGAPMGQDWGKVHPDHNCNGNTKTVEWIKKQQSEDLERNGDSEVKVEDSEQLISDPKRDSSLMLWQQCQLNLLEHVEAVQEEVTHRMDLIERELDVLESWLDYTGELEPPDPLARLPQLKHRMRQLLTDLGTVQQIAVCSSST
ncbi:PHD finger protein 20b isoform X2 [Denticeps clupeoides]|uniref:C2H2-type domain-containing protein n=1 Tax=Denticeps clupeoides TaxID=299321 RepID=A0AAY4DTL1_9TELE|nr:PHD finger protein 20-like isoform X2 [Denticeps clupeoides]